MGITAALWQSALKTSKSVSRVASLVFLTPFLALVILKVVFKEDILISTIYGIILIFLGLFLQKYFTRKNFLV